VLEGEAGRVSCVRFGSVAVYHPLYRVTPDSLPAPRSLYTKPSKVILLTNFTIPDRRIGLHWIQSGTLASGTDGAGQ
jgi:hypothetical protein